MLPACRLGDGRCVAGHRVRMVTERAHRIPQVGPLPLQVAADRRCVMGTGVWWILVMALLAVVEGGAGGWRIDRDALTDTIRAARVLLPPPSTNGAVPLPRAAWARCLLGSLHCRARSPARCRGPQKGAPAGTRTITPSAGPAPDCRRLFSFTCLAVSYVIAAVGAELRGGGREMRTRVLSALALTRCRDLTSLGTVPDCPHTTTYICDDVSSSRRSPAPPAPDPTPRSATRPPASAPTTTRAPARRGPTTPGCRPPPLRLDIRGPVRFHRPGRRIRLGDTYFHNGPLGLSAKSTGEVGGASITSPGAH